MCWGSILREGFGVGTNEPLYAQPLSVCANRLGNGCEGGVVLDKVEVAFAAGDGQTCAGTNVDRLNPVDVDLHP